MDGVSGERINQEELEKLRLNAEALAEAMERVSKDVKIEKYEE